MVQQVIEALLKTKIGFDPNIIGSSAIAKAVRQRQSACGLPDLSTYLRQLQTSSQELSKLIEQVVVPETWFFRHREAFSFLGHYVKSEWLPIHPYSKLRVLSIPCSTGEEPYSTAITLIEAGLATNRFSIDAVDVSNKVIIKATRAIYGSNSFRGDKLAFRKRYFQQTAEGYQLCNLVKKTVNFLQGNILNPLFLAKRGKYDVIFCRNLLIYFEPSARKHTIDTLTRSLTNKGLLFVGCAETGQMISNGFVSVRQPSTFAYRKVERDVETRRRGDTEMGRQGGGGMGKWGAEETRRRGDAETRKQGGGEMGRWGDEEMGGQGRQGDKEELPIPNSRFPIPNSQTTNNKQQTTNNNQDSLLETARSLANQGQLEEAAALCENYLSQNRTNAQAYVLLGEVHQGLGNDKQAEQYFRKAIYLEPNSYEALVHLALIQEHRGEYKSAATIRQRIERLPKN